MHRFGALGCAKKALHEMGNGSTEPGSPEAACRSSLQTTLRCCGGNAVVLSGKETASMTGQVAIVKMNASEPLMTHRNTNRPHQNQCLLYALGQAERTPAYWLCGVRCGGGMSTMEALVENLGSWPAEQVQPAMRLVSGGLTRSSVEAPVMGGEPRGQFIQI